MSQIWEYPDAATLTGFSFIGSAGEQVLNCPIATLDARYGGGTSALLKANNLSDLTSVPDARTNLGLGSAALLSAAALLLTANNLSELTGTASTARTNLGATATGASLFTAASAAAARSILGLGDLAVLNTINNLNWSGQALAIGNGGTGQTTAAAAFNALSPLTTKGDLVAYQSGANVRVGVGANGTVLTAASGSTGGFAWGTPVSITAQFVLAASDASMANARVLTAASGISISNAVANQTIVGIATAGISNAMLATMTDQRVKGNISGGTASPSDLTSAQVTAFLTNFVGDSGAGGTKGLVPAPGAGDAAAGKVLGADGTWVAQSGSGGAPTDATYLTLTTNATLSAERTFTVSAELTTVDAGAGSTYTLSITTGGIANAKLANMAESTFKGRAASSGTGVPVDLTATQATAILNNFTGDSGAGGVKGLVPAPAAGDAAAGKFLKADGTWEAPAGGGGITLSSTNAWTGVNSFTITDAVTTSVTTSLSLAHASSGTVAAGFGAGLAYNLENASGTTTAAMSLNAVFSTATGGAENVDFSVALKAAGVAPAEKFLVTSAGVASAGGTILLKQNRTLAVSGGVTIDGATSTLDLSANRTIGYSALTLSTITPDPAADWVPFWDTDGAVMGKCLMMDVRPLESWVFALTPEHVGYTNGSVSLTFRAPYAFKVTDVEAMWSFNTGAFSTTISVFKGITEPAGVTVNFTGGTNILSSNQSISAAGNTTTSPASMNAATNSLASNEWVGILVTTSVAGGATNNAGIKVTLIGYRL